MVLLHSLWQSRFLRRNGSVTLTFKSGPSGPLLLIAFAEIKRIKRCDVN
jgi:hypothetical protein